MQISQIEKLESVFGKEQAYALADILDISLQHEFDLRELATKHDLKELETSLKKDMKELELSTKHEIKELELRLKIWLITAFILISAFFKALDYFMK